MEQRKRPRALNEPRPHAPPHRLPGARAAAGRWARFLAGLLVMLIFAFGVIPLLQRLGPVRAVREATRNQGIDASALFYTESDAFSEAEASIRNAMRYPAHRAERPGPPKGTAE